MPYPSPADKKLPKPGCFIVSLIIYIVIAIVIAAAMFA